MEDSSSLPDVVASSDSGLKMFVFPKQRGGGDATTNNHRPRHTATISPSQQPAPVSDSDDDVESATTPIQFWSPVPAERPTPPFESTSTVVVLPGNNPGHPVSAPDSPSGGSRGRGAKVNRMISFFRRRTRSVPIAPNPSSPDAAPRASAVVTDAPTAVAVDVEEEGEADGAPRYDPATPPTPLSTLSIGSRSAVVVVPAASPYQVRQGHDDGSSSLDGLPRAPFAGARDLLPLTPPSVFDGGNNGSDGGYSSDAYEDEASVPAPSAQVATNRGLEPEADVENGKLRAEVIVSPAVDAMRKSSAARAKQATEAAAPAVAQELTYRTSEPAVIENGIVMPCPPSEHEKVRRQRRRRWRRGGGRVSSPCFV